MDGWMDGWMDGRTAEKENINFIKENNIKSTQVF
jgi:hypothetical protein